MVPLAQRTSAARPSPLNPASPSASTPRQPLSLHSPPVPGRAPPLPPAPPPPPPPAPHPPPPPSPPPSPPRQSPAVPQPDRWNIGPVLTGPMFHRSLKTGTPQHPGRTTSRTHHS